jgi:hypothetical protein
VELNSVNETDNLSLFEYRQEIPIIVTPYANNNLKAFGIGYPTSQSATNGANYLIANDGTCTYGLMHWERTRLLSIGTNSYSLKVLTMEPLIGEFHI